MSLAHRNFSPVRFADLKTTQKNTKLKGTSFQTQILLRRLEVKNVKILFTILTESSFFVSENIFVTTFDHIEHLFHLSRQGKVRA